jgi:hypothetical protein
MLDPERLAALAARAASNQLDPGDGVGLSTLDIDACRAVAQPRARRAAGLGPDEAGRGGQRP